MSHRHLFGEEVSEIWEVAGHELSEVLAEAALLVKEIETQGPGFFTINQQFNVESGQYEITVFVRE